MTEFDAFLDKMRVTRVDHLLVIAAFCNRIGLTDMMSTKFLGIQIVKIAGLCRLAEALTDTQRQYMAALGLSETDLLCCCR